MVARDAIVEVDSMRACHAVAVFAATTALYSQSLEVRYANPPFENDRTLAGTVRNISGSTIYDDVDVLVFVFGDHGLFLGTGRDTIQGPIQNYDFAHFYVNIKHTGQRVSKYYMQFDGPNSSLSYRVIGGTTTTLSDAESGVQESSMASKNCKLLIVGIAESSYKSKPTLAGRLRNISSDTIKYPKARITYFDRNGSYVGESSGNVKVRYLEPSAEVSFDVRLSPPIESVTHQLDFVDLANIKVPHCSK